MVYLKELTLINLNPALYTEIEKINKHIESMCLLWLY